MARRNQSVFDILVAAPWPIGIAFGAVAFVVIRHGFAALFNSLDNPFAQSFAKAMEAGALEPFAWLVLAMGVLASLVSLLLAGKRRRQLESRSGLESLRKISWREFETLTAELFRRRGYRVEATGGGGADGGIDLKLHRDGELELVQCKQWRQRQVSVSTVREVYGLLQHHGAKQAWIVSCGEFTRDANAFADGKPIALISGTSLLEAIQSVQVAPRQPSAGAAVAASTPACPACGEPMTRRKSRRNGEEFWGCRTYPTCRGTRSLLQATT